MKNQLFALIGLGLLLATASAYAQTGVMKANVPFNFIVDKTDVPAGQYVIQVRHYRHRLAIESSDREPGKAGSAEFLRIVTGASEVQTGFPPLR